MLFLSKRGGCNDMQPPLLFVSRSDASALKSNCGTLNAG